jgi:hypothetical protein
VGRICASRGRSDFSALKTCAPRALQTEPSHRAMLGEYMTGSTAGLYHSVGRAARTEVGTFSQSVHDRHHPLRE